MLDFSVEKKSLASKVPRPKNKKLIREMNPIHAADELEGKEHFSKMAGIGYSKDNSSSTKPTSPDISKFINKKIEARVKRKGKNLGTDGKPE